MSYHSPLRFPHAILLFLPMVAVLLGCLAASDQRVSSAVPSPAIAASSSYLASAVRDVMGDDQSVLVLAEPGMCPGHFDLRPSQVRQLRSLQNPAAF